MKHGSNTTSNKFRILFYSDGCGRTGVYLNIDANLELAEKKYIFDVFGYIKLLRKARHGMIDNVVSNQHFKSESH